MNDTSPKYPFDSFQNFEKHWEAVVGPHMLRAKDALGHTVAYGQMYLKAMLVLNGGGIFVVPAFAEALGDLWGTGHIAPVVAVSCFIFGVVSAATSTGLAFYAFLCLQGHYTVAATRAGAALNNQYRSIVVDGKWVARDDAPSADEKKWVRRARSCDLVAQGFGWLSGFAFIAGSLAGVYIIGCGSDGGQGLRICS